MSLRAGERGGASFPLACLLALAAAAALLLPGLGSTELRVEEGRRAWTARTMLEGGDLVVPRIWGRPYLSKPPLHPWIVAALSAPGGEVTPATTRLPAALASLALVLCLLAFAWSRLGPRAALSAALLLVCSPLFVEKGRLGELEALLSLTTFLSVAFLGLALERPRALPPALLAGLALGAALLTKGPPALVFFLGAAAGLWWIDRGARGRILALSGAALVTGLAVAGAWVAALLARLPAGSTVSHWAGELVSQGSRGPWSYLAERPEYVLATVLGMLPASLVLLVLARRGLLAELAADRRTRLALCAALPAWLVFLVYPGTAARYVFPILPWVALLGAARLDDIWSGASRAEREHGASPAERRARRAGIVAAILVALVALAGLASGSDRLRALGVDPFSLRALSPGIGALCAGIAALLAAALALRALRRRRPVPGALALAVALVSLLSMNQRATDLRRSSRHQAHLAARLEQHLPPGARLHVGFWNEFNLLFLLERELVHVESASATPPGGLLLLPARAPRPASGSETGIGIGNGGQAPGFEELFVLEGPRSGPLVLLRAPPAPRQ